MGEAEHLHQYIHVMNVPEDLLVSILYHPRYQYREILLDVRNHREFMIIFGYVGFMPAMVKGTIIF